MPKSLHKSLANTFFLMYLHAGPELFQGGDPVVISVTLAEMERLLSNSSSTGGLGRVQSASATGKYRHAGTPIASATLIIELAFKHRGTNGQIRSRSNVYRP